MRADLPLEVEEDLSYLQREPAVSGREGGREAPPVLHEVSFLSPSPQRAPPPRVLCQCCAKPKSGSEPNPDGEAALPTARDGGGRKKEEDAPRPDVLARLWCQEPQPRSGSRAPGSATWPASSSTTALAAALLASSTEGRRKMDFLSSITLKGKDEGLARRGWEETAPDSRESQPCAAPCATSPPTQHNADSCTPGAVPTQAASSSIPQFQRESHSSLGWKGS